MNKDLMKNLIMTRNPSFFNYLVDFRILPYFLEHDTASIARELVLKYEPLLIAEGEGNDGEWFLRAEFSSRKQAMSCFSFSRQNPLFSINTNLLAKHDGKIQSIWNQPEKRIVKQLHAKLGGKTEASTPVGRIDLLTENQLIEVKPRINWKSGLGQLLAYSKFYPQHILVLYLFDRISPINTSTIIKFCQDASITTIFAIDLGFDYNSDFCAVELNVEP
jgi:hypothetical protein